MKNLSLSSCTILFLFLITSINVISAQQTDPNLKTINGVVHFEKTPLTNVNIILIGTTKGTRTNAKGYYEIEAQIGDVLEFSHVGLKTVSVIIEDITAVLNIRMRENKNELDAAIITARKKVNKANELMRRRNVDLDFPGGRINPMKSGFDIKHITQDDLNPGSLSLKSALGGKFAGVRVIGVPPNDTLYIRDVKASFVMNGIVYDDPPITLDRIKDVFIVKKPIPNVGRIVIIVPNDASHIKKIETDKIAAQHQNQNFYVDDAIALNTNELNSESILTLKVFGNSIDAYKYYQEELKLQLNNYEEHLDIAKFFLSHFKDKQIGVKILMAQAKVHLENPEILKAIAYQLQGFNAKKEAIALYRQLFSLRSNYAQSYRDLANAFKENNQYNKAWRMYMNYLSNGHEIDQESIDQTVYNEMEYLYFKRNKHAEIRETFHPKSESIDDFRNDIRFVLEWNTSEAEFDLEFVSTDKRSYVFEHTLIANQELINDEKRKGYSSKEFFIEDIGIGEWLLNLTYYGNKKHTPTFLKITTYYNWGKPEQRQEISVLKLIDQDIKVQVQQINKQSLIATN